jgi:hypothetical protein
MKATFNVLVALMAILAITVRADLSQDEEGDTCHEEIVHSYRLFPFRPDKPHDKNYICGYIKNDCCSFNSQKLVQVLWARISQPRLQRVLTLHLSHVEFIINNINKIISLFQRNQLPEHVKYSAECLQTIDDMNGFVKSEKSVYLEAMFNEIKTKFNDLYQFKKQFYCQVCNRGFHKFYNTDNKTIQFSNSFCSDLAVKHVKVSYFLNKELIDTFRVVKNYVQCYSNKNYLLLDSTFDFKFKKDELEDINLCLKDQYCQRFCERYSLTDLPGVFIGNRLHLENMRFFLENHIPDNKGMFITEPQFVRKYYEMLRKQQNEMLEEQGKPALPANNQASDGSTDSNMDFFREGENESLEEAAFAVYKTSFDFYKSKFIKKKMSKIRKRISEEYDQDLVFQNFLTTNKAKIDLSKYRSHFDSEGLNPYELLNKENIYTINANLTLFSKEISNTVGELLYLNETNIIKKAMDSGKIMQSDKESKDAMLNYIKSKIFENSTSANGYLVENSYIDTQMSAWTIGGAAVQLVFLIFALG